MDESKVGTTAGIAPAQKGALSILQFNPVYCGGSEVNAAAREISSYHSPVGDQAERHQKMANALASFLTTLVSECPPGPERSTAISRAREAKMWASAAIALEGH